MEPFLRSEFDGDLQVPFDAAVVMPSILRPFIIRAVKSVYRQEFSGRIQLLIGIDAPIGSKTLIDELLKDRPSHVAVMVLYPGYSTSVRHGGLHPARDGGTLRSLLTYMANSRRVAYLDDDNWWRSGHLQHLAKALEGFDYAHSYRWFVNPKSQKPVCIDEWESIGKDVGFFAKHGGWVDPNTLMIDKLACEEAIRWWSIPGPGSKKAMNADRQVFRILRKFRGNCSGRASCNYLIDPSDYMHANRIRYAPGLAELLSDC